MKKIRFIYNFLVISLYNFLGGVKIILKDELIEKVLELAKKLNRRPMKRDDNYLNYYAKKYFGSWNKMMKHAGFNVIFYQKINSIKFDENFAYFLGLLITDGHIVYNKSGKYKVAIYNSYPEEKNMISQLIKNIFNYKVGISSRMYGFNKKPNYEIRISSRNLAKILVDDIGVPSGAKSLNVRIPKVLFNKNPRILGAFLRGVIDGDGSVLKGAIKIASGSIIFLKELKIILKNLGISSSSITKDNRKTNTFSIRIYNHNNLIKFYYLIYPKNIKFYYNRKKIKWKNNIFKYGFDSIKNNYLAQTCIFTRRSG